MNTILIFWEAITPGSFQIKKNQSRNGQVGWCFADTPITAAHDSHEVQCTGISCSSGMLNFRNFFTIGVVLFTLQAFLPSPLCLQNQLEHFFSKLPFFSESFWAKCLGLKYIL